MIIKAFKKGQLYTNYLGPLSAILGNLIATPILITNLGLSEWSLFALVSILLPIVYFILFGSHELVRRLMINIFLGNKKTFQSINIFYKYERKIFIRFVPSVILLSFLLIILNSDNYDFFKTIELSFIIISIAVLIKVFEIYYSELLNGLKQHYKLHLYAFVITVLKWSSIIYLSFFKEINVNVLLLTLIIYSCLLLIIQRIIILNIFKKKQEKKINKNQNVISNFNKSNFGAIIILIWLFQHFDKVLVFGILDPLSLSYFGIAFMLCRGIQTIVLPIVNYFTPEIYETVEQDLKDRKKYFSKLIVSQFLILVVFLIIVLIYLEQILNVWLGNNLNFSDIKLFVIPLSIGTLSISIINSLKFLFIAENKISLMKKPSIIVVCLLIGFTALIYFNVISVEIYLYCWSISMFLLLMYFYFIFFNKNYKYQK